MNLLCDAVLTKSPNFINLGISSVRTSDELGSVFIPTTRIGRPMDGSNLLSPVNLIFEVTADRMSRTRSEQNYIAKTDFETRRENQDFGRQNISMRRPPLDSTPLGTHKNNGKTSPIDSIPVGKKRRSLCHWQHQRICEHYQRICQSKMEKCTYQGNRIQTHHCQTHHQKNLIRWITPTPVNQLKSKLVRRKIVGNTRNSTRQTRRRAILIRLTIVTTEASNIKEDPLENGSSKIMCRFNGKVADDST